MKLRAFTLIELLIVVAIIAILAAIAVPNFLEAQTRAKVSRCKADMRSCVTALESYRVDSNKYPPMFDSTGGGALFVRIPNYLTTPIAYMTSLVYDPFVTDKAVQNIPPYPGLESRRYVYYDTVTLASPAPVGFSSDDQESPWRPLSGWVGAWLLYGYGPDRVYVDSSVAPNSTLLPYDPTNGTISYGNILRTQKMTDGIPVHPRTGTYQW